MVEVLTEEAMRGDYLDFKVNLLAEIGLTDEGAVKQYLEAKSSNAATETKRRIQIDNAARKLMMDFYDGDTSYVKQMSGMDYYNIIKSKFPKTDALFEDVIIHLTGKVGFDMLRENHLIEACEMLNGHRLYAI